MSSKAYMSTFAEFWRAIWTITNLWIPIVAVLAAWEGGIWAWVIPIMILVIIPLFDELLKKLDQAWFQTRGDMGNGLQNLYSLVNMLFTIFCLPVFILVLLALKNNIDIVPAIGTIISFSIYGSLVFGNSHDFMNRVSKWGYHLGVFSQKMFFFPANFENEHMASLHTRKWMYTPRDVESAPQGMSFFKFFLKLYKVGDEINLMEEKKRLSQKGLPWKTIHNRLLQTRFVRFAIVICLFVFFPIPIAVIGMIMLFVVSASYSYLGCFQQYGLERESRKDGRPDVVCNNDSWDRNDPEGKYVYFGGTRHPIHHMRAALPYWKQLRVPTYEFELPFSYHHAAILSLFHPSFRRIMEKRMRKIGVLEDNPWLGRLRVKRRSGKELSEESLKGLCDLREEVMEFKSSELLISERVKLKNYAKAVDYAYTIEDREGTIMGFFLIDHLSSSDSKRAHLQIDYMYVHPKLNGSFIFTWMFIRSGIDTFWKVKGKEVWFIAVGAFPMGYRSVWKFGGMVTHSKDPSLPSDVREAMITLAQTQCKERWNPDTECIEIATVPPTYPPEVMERFKKEGWWAPYHSVCPNWRDGYGLLATYKVSIKDFMRAAQIGLNRIMKS